jgi:hypothetical protein
MLENDRDNGTLMGESRKVRIAQRCSRTCHVLSISDTFPVKIFFAVANGIYTWGM